MCIIYKYVYICLYIYIYTHSLHELDLVLVPDIFLGDLHGGPRVLVGVEARLVRVVCMSYNMLIV